MDTKLPSKPSLCPPLGFENLEERHLVSSSELANWHQYKATRPIVSSFLANTCFNGPMSTELGPFGDWLKSVMERRGWANKDLAAAVNTDSGTVSRWRNNRRVPEPESCELIAEALGIDPDIVLVRAGHRRQRRPVEEYDVTEDMMEAKRRMEEAAEAFQTVTVKRGILYNVEANTSQSQSASASATIRYGHATIERMFTENKDELTDEDWQQIAAIIERRRQAKDGG